MDYTYIIPNWFFGFDIAMEILFAIITFLVAIFAFRVGRLTKERKIKLFGMSFLLIGLSYLLWAGINFWFANLGPDGLQDLTIQGVTLIGTLSLYAYTILFTSGLATLAYLTCDVKKGKVYYLVFGLSLLVLFSSFNKLAMFSVLSIFLISVITYHYFEEYLKNKNKKSLLVLVAFLFLFVGNIAFIYSSVYYQAYVAGHVLELVAYVLILINLIKTVKR